MDVLGRHLHLNPMYRSSPYFRLWFRREVESRVANLSPEQRTKWLVTSMLTSLVKEINPSFLIVSKVVPMVGAALAEAGMHELSSLSDEVVESYCSLHRAEVPADFPVLLERTTREWQATLLTWRQHKDGGAFEPKFLFHDLLKLPAFDAALASLTPDSSASNRVKQMLGGMDMLTSVSTMVKNDHELAVTAITAALLTAEGMIVPLNKRCKMFVRSMDDSQLAPEVAQQMKEINSVHGGFEGIAALIKRVGSTLSGPNAMLLDVASRVLPHLQGGGRPGSGLSTLFSLLDQVQSTHAAAVAADAAVVHAARAQVAEAQLEQEGERLEKEAARQREAAALVKAEALQQEVAELKRQLGERSGKPDKKVLAGPAAKRAVQLAERRAAFGAVNYAYEK